MDGDSNDLPLHVTPAQAWPLRNQDGERSVQVMQHGSMEVRWFRPDAAIQHLPHDRDELYFVVSGTAKFHRGNEADPFDEGTMGLLGEQATAVQPGDVLFVPAGAAHSFSDTSGDFAVWAVFYGPEGGEQE